MFLLVSLLACMGKILSPKCQEEQKPKERNGGVNDDEEEDARGGKPRSIFCCFLRRIIFRFSFSPHS